MKIIELGRKWCASIGVENPGPVAGKGRRSAKIASPSLMGRHDNGGVGR